METLTLPYQWENRMLLIREGVFYIPPHYPHGNGFHICWDAIFGNPYPVHIEYCSGHGEWIARQAADNRKVNWVAVERQFPRVQKIFSRRAAEKLDNLFIVYGNGEKLSENYMQTDSVEAIYVNFPDPWPKRRHAKNRIIQRRFTDELSRIVQKNGTATFVTDDESYTQQMKKEMAPHWQLVSTAPENAYGTSYFQRKWIEEGRTIYYLKYSNSK